MESVVFVYMKTHEPKDTTFWQDKFRACDWIKHYVYMQVLLRHILGIHVLTEIMIGIYLEYQLSRVTMIISISYRIVKKDRMQDIKQTIVLECSYWNINFFLTIYDSSLFEILIWYQFTPWTFSNSYKSHYNYQGSGAYF